MKIIIATQIGFFISDVILVTLLDADMKTITTNHVALTIGYFLCRYIQERASNEY